MRAESSALLAAAAAQVEARRPALTRARPEPVYCSPRHCASRDALQAAALHGHETWT